MDKPDYKVKDAYLWRQYMQDAVIRKYRFPGAKVDCNIWKLGDIFKGTSIEGDMDKALEYWGHPEKIPPEDLKAMYRIHKISVADQFRIEGLYI